MSFQSEPGTIRWKVHFRSSPDMVFDALATEHLTQLAAFSCDVLLLGTGLRQRFPSPALLRPLIESGRGFEIMDTAAACRTYNILVGEGRIVLAALIVESSTG